MENRYIAGIVLALLTALFCLASCSGTQEREVGGPYPGPGGTYEEPGVAVEPVDINSATVADLMTVPGMDQVTAQNIVQYREVNGPFDSVDGLLNVSGIDEQRLDTLRDWITVMEPGTGQQDMEMPSQDESAPIEQDPGDVFHNGEYQ
ncbi:MAG: helix-hairpin-helix domain-containing protein [Desulfomonilia bacterium]|jgi:competence ComEA-like helix-hairpin-helix protein